LTVSEIFPVEIRAQAISVVFATAQSFGALAPPLFGWIIAEAKKTPGFIELSPLGIAYVGSAAIMFGGGLIAWFFGVDAEGKSLEDVAPPLSAVETPHVTPHAPADSPHGHDRV
jgi:hypothetical protein